MRIQVHTSLEPIRDVWDALAPRDRVVLESAHLLAIERSGINDLRPYYLVGYDGSQPVGIAYCSVMRSDLALTAKNLSPERLAALRCWHPDFLYLPILECGVVSGIGQGMAATNGSEPALFSTALAEMERIGAEAGASLVLVRDIPYERLDKYRFLTGQGYAPVLGYPVAMMASRWTSMEGYLAALKCARRKRIRRFLSRMSPDLEIEVQPRFAQHAARMAQLWRQTHMRAQDYSHDELNEAYFREMDCQLGDRSRAILLRKNGKIVGFTLCLSGDEEFCSLHTGLDYEHQGDDHLYTTLTLAELAEAFARNPRTINMGITAYDYKFRFGFEAVPLVYMVKHIAQPRMTFALADSFLESIKQPVNVHRPFRDQDTADRPDLAALANRLAAEESHRSGDAFAKAWAYHRINKFKISSLYTFFPPFEGAQGPVLQYRGRPIVMLGANAYSGLATHPEVVEAAKAAIDKYGTGCSGSPVMNGTLDIHVELARSLAAFMQKDDALVFSTGYQTNVGILSALVRKDDVVIMDRLNHASLVDGARMAQAQVERFRHNDIESLEKVLIRHAGRGKLVVIDSVFSMEGTISDLPVIVDLCQKHGARLMLDEAHAIGLLGPGGRGAAELHGVLDKVDIIMGTFSKAFASIGGFVVGNATVIDYLRHECRSHLFSASLPPSAVATVQKTLEIIQREPERRARALANARYMAERLQALGYEAPYRGTAIVPVFCGHELVAFGLFKKLFELGVFTNPVPSPAVPKGRELLRTSFMPTHTTEMLDRALAAFAAARTPTFPKAAAAASSARQPQPSPGIRPMLVMSVADRRSFRDCYVGDSQHGLLRFSGLNHLEIGQAVDCVVALQQEGLIVQSQGIVVSTGAPRPGLSPGTDVELLPTELGARGVIEKLIQGEAPPATKRRFWRYHAAIDVDYPAETGMLSDSVQDISLDGAAIRSLRDVEPAACIPLLLRAPACDPIEVTGEVRWSRRGNDPTFGVRFVFATPQERGRVGALITSIERAVVRSAS